MSEFNEEELMWIYIALCDYDEHHSKNLNEKSINSLRNLVHKVEKQRHKQRHKKEMGEGGEVKFKVVVCREIAEKGQIVDIEFINVEHCEWKNGELYIYI